MAPVRGALETQVQASCRETLQGLQPSGQPGSWQVSCIPGLSTWCPQSGGLTSVGKGECLVQWGWHGVLLASRPFGCEALAWPLTVARLPPPMTFGPSLSF